MGVPNGATEASGRGVRKRKPKAADGFVVEMPIRKVSIARRPDAMRRAVRANTRPLTCAFDSTVLPPDELSSDPEGEFPRCSNEAPVPVKKGLWTAEEDERLAHEVRTNGCRNWAVIARSLSGRVAKQCRERWHNHLKPDICKEPWTEQEDLQIQLGVLKHGHKWSTIALGMPGRTDNQIKNRYNCTVQKYGEKECQESGMSTKAFLDELKRRNARTELEALPLMRLANPKFLLKSGWKGAEVAKLQNAMRAAQEDGHHPDWEMVALMVGNRSVVACKAQWRRMCEMWGSRDRAANVVLQPVPAVAAPTPVEVESALAMAEAAASAAAEAAAEDEFVSSAGEAAWNEIKLMCFEEYSEGSATEPQWTRSFQWDLPTHETRHKAFGFDFRHPPRPLQLALHMFDVRRHLLPDGHTGKRGSLDATMSWTARDCTPKTDPKMTEHYMEKKRRAEEEEALVKSVLG